MYVFIDCVRHNVTDCLDDYEKQNSSTTYIEAEQKQIPSQRVEQSVQKYMKNTTSVDSFKLRSSCAF